jgi:tRNA-specific 2-thiouridylase
VCNTPIKFGALLDSATQNGLAYAATGHYARIMQDENGRYLVRRARDEKKDQSYMLWSLSQDVLSRVKLPLGELTKDEVRAIAAAHGFESANRRDSQDICFLPDGNYADFIRRYAGHKPLTGHFVDREGNILGDHPGMLHYTIGQRKGLGIALGRPMYVCDKNADTGDVVLCDNAQLYSTTLKAKSVNFIPFDRLTAPMRVEAKIRYAHTAAPATVYPTGNDTVRVEFDTPQRAIARGQSVVFYDGDLLVGGGIIE